jgi:hypothetical protein
MNYNSKISEVQNFTASGNIDEAISNLDSQNSSSDPGLLYYMEKGELLRLKNDYLSSRESWLSADKIVQEWEQKAKFNPTSLLEGLGSVTISDTTRTYEGRDYEKVFLSVRLALDHLAIRDWDSARIEIKKMHEREAIIANFHERDLEDAKAKADEKGVKATSFSELNGYPIETLEAPDVRELKNSYESAIGNYLAGFVYEELGEESLSAPGYRKASEMRPGNKMIDSALQGLSSRMHHKDQNKSEVLIVIESGDAPAIMSQTIPIVLPIPSGSGVSMIAVGISWPVIRPDESYFIPSSVSLDDTQSAEVEMLTSVNAMARRALYDEMPGIIARSSVRAIIKGATQKVVDDNTSDMGILGALISLSVKAVSIATEQADERSWRTLPGYFSIARVQLSPGQHKLSILTPNGGIQSSEISISKKYEIVTLRVMGDRLFVAQPQEVSKVSK